MKAEHTVLYLHFKSQNPTFGKLVLDFFFLNLTEIFKFKMAKKFPFFQEIGQNYFFQMFCKFDFVTKIQVFDTFTELIFQDILPFWRKNSNNAKL